MDPIIPSIICGCENESKARFEIKNNTTDAEEYDFCSKRTYLTRPNNLIESAIHMLMCGLGGGLVALHVAYMECGLFAAMATNVFLSAVVGYCACILIWSAQKLYGRVQMHELTYPDVMEAAVRLSPWPKLRKAARGSRYLVEVTLLCHLYGSCCVFIIMIARNLKELASGDGSIDDGGNPPIKVVILCLMVPCAIICMVTDLKKLAPFALICDLFGVALILVILWYSLHDIKDSPMYRPPYKSLTGLVQFSCVCVFVLEPMCYALPIENNMKHPKKFHFVILTAMPIYTVAMLTVGFFGYWYYGEYAVAPITVHFPSSSFALTLKVFLCLSLYMVFGLCFYLAFDIEWYYLRRNHKLSNYWFWERVYRTLHVVALCLIAYGLPNVTRMMGIFGAISTTPAILIYPPFIELLLNWEHPGLGSYKWRLQKCILMMSLGLVLVVAGTYYNIVGLNTEISSNLMLQPQKRVEKADSFWRRKTYFNASDLKYNLTYNRRDSYKTEYENIDVIPNKPIDVFRFNNNNTKLLPNLNKISVLTNKTFNVIPNNNSISIVINNTGNIIPNNSIIVLLVNNTIPDNNR